MTGQETLVQESRLSSTGRSKAKPRIQRENKFCILHKKLTISKIYGRAMTKIIHKVTVVVTMEGRGREGGAFPIAISVSNFHY